MASRAFPYSRPLRDSPPGTVFAHPSFRAISPFACKGPGGEEALGEGDEEEEGDTHDREQGDLGEEAGDLELGFVLDHEEPQALAGTDPLADDGPDNAVGYGQ